MRTCCRASTLGASTGAKAQCAPSAAPEAHTAVSKKHLHLQRRLGMAKIMSKAYLHMVQQSIDQDAGCKSPSGPQRVGIQFSGGQQDSGVRTATS